MSVYFITKASRLGDHPYYGPTCEAAGVEPAKWYESREEAEKDAAKLSACNPVGFVVKEAICTCVFGPPFEKCASCGGRNSV